MIYKRPSEEGERQVTERKKRSANHTSNKGLVLEYVNDSQNSTAKKK